MRTTFDKNPEINTKPAKKTVSTITLDTYVEGFRGPHLHLQTKLHFSYLSITPEDSTQFANKEIEIK